MTIREALNILRAEYEAMSVDELSDLVDELNIETDAVNHAALVDAIMAVEEYAAFH